MNKSDDLDWACVSALDKPMAELFSIGDLSDEFGITTRTIRFYEDKGLIAPQRVSGVRTYNRRDRARLILILRGKRLGFSLEVIAEYLSLYDADPTQVAQLKHLESQVLAAIGNLEQQRMDLERTLEELGDIRNKVITALNEKDRPS